VRQLECDIAIVAGGAAGLAAAVAASENGAQVIVCEKAGHTGGCGNMASGLLAVESRYQKQMQLPLSREEVFEYHMTYTHWRADARLVRAYLDKSADTIDWLETMGVEFLAVESHGPGNKYTWHVVKAPWPMGTCRLMMDILADKARQAGTQILLKAPVKSLIKEGARITGVTAVDEYGEDLEIRAEAAVIATGGIYDNPAMIKEHTGFEVGRDLILRNRKGATGDGLRMAWEAGAAQTDIIMHFMQQSAFVGPAVSASFLQPNLVVNLQGERFMNEEVITSNNMFSGNAIALQRDKCAFSIMDEAAKNHYVETGYDFQPAYGVAQWGAHLKADGFEAEMHAAAAKGTEGAYIAGSLAELAAMTGIDREGLAKTVFEYNQACDTGRDTLFDRKARYLRPIRRPPFYARKFFLDAFGSLGGIRIDYRGRVLDTEGDVIPGLYAAGADAEAIYGDTYPITLPGSTMGFAVNSGRIAGENAAEYAARTQFTRARPIAGSTETPCRTCLP
jgi:fumarate reductase flavoprotein subunit